MSTTLTLASEVAWLAMLGVTELFAGARPRSTDHRRQLRNLGFTAVNHVVIPPVGLLCVYLTAPLRPGTAWLSLPPAYLGIPTAIVVLDLAAYWVHRAVHRSTLLWRFHQIHHLDEGFDVSTGLRVHTAESAMHHLVMVTVATVAGIPAGYLAVYGTVAFFLDMFHHSNIAIPVPVEKSLRLVIITPSLHVTHHLDQIEDTDTNFGFVFNWWDRMFCTFNTRPHSVPGRIGLDYSGDLDFVHLVVQPFLPTPLNATPRPRHLTVIDGAESPVPLDRPAVAAQPPIAVAPAPHIEAA